MRVKTNTCVVLGLKIGVRHAAGALWAYTFIVTEVQSLSLTKCQYYEVKQKYRPYKAAKLRPLGSAKRHQQVTQEILDSQGS